MYNVINNKKTLPNFLLLLNQFLEWRARGWIYYACYKIELENCFELYNDLYIN